MAKRKSTGLTNRDLGISGGSGKGSASRVKSSAKYAKNYGSINWGPKAPVAPTWSEMIKGGTFPKNAGETITTVNKHNRTVDNDYSGI